MKMFLKAFTLMRNAEKPSVKINKLPYENFQ
jgi:hypothetical protein